MNLEELKNQILETPYPRTAYLIYVMSSFLNGKQIQAYNPETDTWEDLDKEPSWGWSRVRYRVKH